MLSLSMLNFEQQSCELKYFDFEVLGLIQLRIETKSTVSVEEDTLGHEIV